MKPWDTQEWRERRRKFLNGKKCEVCGGSENLQIHHKVRPMPYLTVRRIVASEHPNESEEAINALAKARHDQDWDDYLNFRFVRVLCRKHHAQAESRTSRLYV